MWQTYINAANLDDVVEWMSKDPEHTRVVAGATDLLLEMERGQRKGIHTLVDISRVVGIDHIKMDSQGMIHLGPGVTHNDCVASEVIRRYALPLAQACWQVGSPQIRNRGTIAGNIITASPANDTITPLMALNASVQLRSVHGTRTIKLDEFYLGVRKTVMQPDEVVVNISFPALHENDQGVFQKFALRQAQAISVANICVILTTENRVVQNARITLGAVAPRIIHANDAEKFLVGKLLTPDVVALASELTMQAARPISDVRSSDSYRKIICRVLAKRSLNQLANHKIVDDLPERMVLLRSNGPKEYLQKTRKIVSGDRIKSLINGKPSMIRDGFSHNLLNFIRYNVGLTGTKEGCAEGECGACSIDLDGQVVMGCMVPGPRADGARIKTVESLSTDHSLHPLQKAFIEAGAVQCGFCTPGFLMSGSKLLEEIPNPNIEQIKQAFSGNLCRCTGYYKIIEAVEAAISYGGSDGKV
jgi:xanthine dehydrogenase iron-sulfur cluster and FAD-binding subunit A